MFDNLYPESIEGSGNFLRLALQYISRHKHPYNPIIYAVWYEYVTGRNEPLLNDIHALEKESIDIPAKIMFKLFRKHVADNKALLAEKKISEFQTILREMTIHLGNSGSKMDNQGSTLETYAKDLGQATSMETISAIAKNIVTETKAMLASSQALKNQMDATVLEINTLKKEKANIKQTAKTDMLTGLLNRMAFDEALAEAMGQSDSQNHPLSIIFTDIDHFKKLNDTHGHLMGDKILKILSRHLKDHIKGKDIASRFGGEEFILILPDTPLEGAFVLAEQIRMSIQTMKWMTRDSGKSIGSVTISLGVAQYKPKETRESLIGRADTAMYFAKEKGRNKTMTELDIAGA
jgi:diguanylate cyclase